MVSIHTQTQACAAFQACTAQKDPSICLQEMLASLSGAAGGAAGGAPCQTLSPCQGGAAAPMPMPMPMPMPQPMPMPMPMPMPYPAEQVIVEPASCGGTYPCKDKATKSKAKKHHDKKSKKHQ